MLYSKVLSNGDVCRADKCREAFTQSQGMVLFGSKIKLSLLDLHGKIT